VVRIKADAPVLWTSRCRRTRCSSLSSGLWAPARNTLRLRRNRDCPL